MQTGVLRSEDVTRATQHVVSIGETLKRIYDRACDMAVNNSNDLLLAIDSSEAANENLSVKAAAKQHRNDLEKFLKKEVDMNVPHQSHAKLLKSIEQTGLNREPSVREKAERSNRAWEIAISIGTIVVAVGLIIVFVIMKC